MERPTTRKRTLLDAYPAPLSEPFSPRSYGDDQVNEMSFTDLIDILLKGKWLILLVLVAVASAAIAYTFTIAPEYEAHSTVQVGDGGAAMNTELAQLMGVESANRKIANEVEILNSRSIALVVADSVRALRVIPELETPFTVLGVATSTREQVANQIMARRTITPVGRDVDIIRITIASTIPEEAAVIANIYAAKYQERNTAMRRSRLTITKDFLNEQHDLSRDDLSRAEQALATFAEREGTVALSDEATLLVERIATLQGEGENFAIDLEMARGELDKVEEQLRQIEPNLSQRINSNVDQVLVGLQQRLAQEKIEAENIYADNPDLRGLSVESLQASNHSQADELVRILNRISEFEDQVDLRTDEVVSLITTAGGIVGSGDVTKGGATQFAELSKRKLELESQIAGLEARLTVINKNLQERQTSFNAIPGKELDLARLKRDQQSKELINLRITEKLQEVRVAEMAEIGDVQVVDAAYPNYGAVKPNKFMNIMLGVILGLGLGIGLVFLRNAMDSRIHRPEDLRSRGYSVLGVIPSMEQMIKDEFRGKELVQVDGRSYGTSLITLLNPLSPIAEAYRGLRTNIQFSIPDTVIQTLLVTSSGPGEGKTVTAANLAVTMAQAGRRTLYMDADLRRPRLQRMIEVPREPGLVDVLFDNSPPQPTEIIPDLLYVLPAGSSAPNPAELLGSHKMRQFLDHMRTQFDLIVIDSPPVLAVTDALLVATQSDATVVVTSANETDWHALERTDEALKSVGASFIGVTLNRFDAKTAYGYYRYGYGYGYGYEDYYGDKQSSKA